MALMKSGWAAHQNIRFAGHLTLSKSFKNDAHPPSVSTEHTRYDLWSDESLFLLVIILYI